MNLAFFDFDSTLIEQEVIDELAALNGKKEEVSRLTRETMEGKYTFSQTIRLRTAALKGLTRADLVRVADSIRFRKNFNNLMEWLKNHDFKTAIISGSFENVLSLLPQTRRFDFFYTNLLYEEDGQLTGDCLPRVSDNKGQIAQRLQEKLGLPPQRCMAVGDGATDIPVFQRSGFSIALNAKPVVRQSASVALDTNDLADLIPLTDRWMQSQQ